MFKTQLYESVDDKIMMILDTRDRYVGAQPTISMSGYIHVGMYGHIFNKVVLSGGVFNVEISVGVYVRGKSDIAHVYNEYFMLGEEPPGDMFGDVLDGFFSLGMIFKEVK